MDGPLNDHELIDSHAPEVFSCGYLIFRLGRPIQFLLMQHPARWDLPKGHMDRGETSPQTALRELQEETGIEPHEIWTDPHFHFVQQYLVQPYKSQQFKAKIRSKSQTAKPTSPTPMRLKQLDIYLGWLRVDRQIVASEHQSYRWFDWSPPHTIQLQTIDPLLREVAQYFSSLTSWPPSDILKA